MRCSIFYLTILKYYLVHLCLLLRLNFYFVLRPVFFPGAISAFSVPPLLYLQFLAFCVFHPLPILGIFFVAELLSYVAFAAVVGSLGILIDFSFLLILDNVFVAGVLFIGIRLRFGNMSNVNFVPIVVDIRVICCF